jgi:hypothetical protein
VDLLSPSTGTLLLPDRGTLQFTSPVLLGNGSAVASIVTHFWSNRWEVLDTAGRLVAQGRPEGAIRPSYVLRTPEGRELVAVRMGWWRTYDDAEVRLADGRAPALRRTGGWPPRHFEIVVMNAPLVRIEPTKPGWAQPLSFTIEIGSPGLSVLEAIGLVEAIRHDIRRRRRRSS